MCDQIKDFMTVMTGKIPRRCHQISDSLIPIHVVLILAQPLCLIKKYICCRDPSFPTISQPLVVIPY